MKVGVNHLFSTHENKMGKVNDMIFDSHANSDDSHEENKMEIIQELKLQKNNQSMKDCTDPSSIDDKNSFEGEAFEQIFLQHCIQKYDVNFLIEWSKTINFRIWCSEHHPNIRCQCEYSGYYDNVVILYENGNIYRGATYKGKKLIKPEQITSKS